LYEYRVKQDGAAEAKGRAQIDGTATNRQLGCWCATSPGHPDYLVFRQLLDPVDHEMLHRNLRLLEP
jgi:hypothetical protein